MRWHGYRADKRYIVFPALEHTLGLSAGIWRVLDKAHRLRNAAEYEGEIHVDERFLVELLSAAEIVHNAGSRLGPVQGGA